MAEDGDLPIGATDFIPLQDPTISRRGQGQKHASTPSFEWPKIPSDTSFDPFSPARLLIPDMHNPFNFLESGNTNNQVIPFEDNMTQEEGVVRGATITAEERALLEHDLARFQPEVLTVADIPGLPPPDDGPRMGIELPWPPSEDIVVAKSASRNITSSTRESTAEATAPRPNRAEIAARKAAAAATLAPEDTSTTGKSQAETLPLEVFIFNEANYDNTDSSGRPFTYLNTLALPVPGLRKPQEIIDAVITELGGEEELGNTAKDLVDAQKKIVGNVCIWGGYLEKGPKLQKSWHFATVDLLKQYLARKKEMAAAGVATQYLVHVKVLLWRRSEAIKARIARKEKLPEREMERGEESEEEDDDDETTTTEI